MTTVPPATVLIAGPAGLTASFSFWPLSVAVLLLRSRRCRWPTRGRCR